MEIKFAAKQILYLVMILWIIDLVVTYVLYLYNFNDDPDFLQLIKTETSTGFENEYIIPESMKLLLTGVHILGFILVIVVVYYTIKTGLTYLRAPKNRKLAHENLELSLILIAILFITQLIFILMFDSVFSGSTLAYYVFAPVRYYVIYNPLNSSVNTLFDRSSILKIPVSSNTIITQLQGLIYNILVITLFLLFVISIIRFIIEKQ